MDAFEADDEVQTLIQNSRKRSGGVERDRAQRRFHLFFEVAFEPLTLHVRPVVTLNESDALPGHGWYQLFV